MVTIECSGFPFRTTNLPIAYARNRRNTCHLIGNVPHIHTRSETKSRKAVIKSSNEESAFLVREARDAAEYSDSGWLRASAYYEVI